MKIEIYIPDSTIQSYIGEIDEGIGVLLTPEQFIDVCSKIKWDYTNLYSGGFGDTEDRDTFIKKFVTKVLSYREPLTYGEIRKDGRDESVVMEEYWNGLRLKANANGYKMRTTE